LILLSKQFPHPCHNPQSFRYSGHNLPQRMQNVQAKQLMKSFIPRLKFMITAKLFPCIFHVFFMNRAKAF
jgi:hypothetical protein